MMLESSSKRLLSLPAHKRSPGKDPEIRLETMRNAGRLKIPYTTGILIGIGETIEEIADSLLEIRKLYDTVIIAESRYKKCFQQKEHSLMLPSADDCTKLDSATLYAPDSVLKYLIIQALYY